MAKQDRLRIEVRKRWPTLEQLLTCYLHQDWSLDDASPEAALDRAMSDYPHEIRSRALAELLDWKRCTRRSSDIREQVNDGFSVNVYFRQQHEAWKFMDLVEEKLSG